MTDIDDDFLQLLVSSLQHNKDGMHEMKKSTEGIMRELKESRNKKIFCPECGANITDRMVFKT